MAIDAKIRRINAYSMAFASERTSRIRWKANRLRGPKASFPSSTSCWRPLASYFRVLRAKKRCRPLSHTRTKAQKDWKVVSKAFPNKTLEEYTYYWLIVNTRSFYFEVPGTVDFAHGDRMVLCPFVDYFNHNDHGVSSRNGPLGRVGAER